MPSIGAQCHLRLIGDVNGDRRADIVGFGATRISVALGQTDGRFAAPIDVFAAFSNADGWRVGEHLRYLADVNGDGRADIVGFGGTQVSVALGQTDGRFASPINVFPHFTNANGWRCDEHLRYLADVNGDRRADIVGFGANQVSVALGQTDGRFAAPIDVFNRFTNADGWRIGEHLRQLADVNGDGRADIVGFGTLKLSVALGQASGRFAAPIDVSNQFTTTDGWREGQHLRQLADVNGDGKADIVGFNDVQVRVSLGQADGSLAGILAPSIPIFNNFSGNQGWRTSEHLRQLADVNGDGRADIVGFGANRVFVALGQTTGRFAAPIEVFNNFSVEDGWQVGQHLRQLADVNGDGRADIVGFGTERVATALGQATGRFDAANAVLNHFTKINGGWETCGEQQRPPALRGWVDMHTHPMSHLGWGGKVFHGAPDIGILVPAIPSGNGCRKYERAGHIAEAIGSCNATHGGVGLDNTCGDDLRKQLLRLTESELADGTAQTAHHEEGARGYPDFKRWPAYNDMTHQQMWIDWIKRAYDGGLRVMVALAVNNATYAAGFSGPGDRNPDDLASANIQIEEMKRMVNRHNGAPGSVDNWMEIATSAADLRRIVANNKLALVLGVEVDNIGNFHKNATVDANTLTDAGKRLVTAEIQRLYDQGVRYIFPIHLVDNKFGGAAIYESVFNYSNYHQTGRFFDVVCANRGEGITKPFELYEWYLGLAGAKMGVDIARRPPTPPACGAGLGHRNRLGLTPMGAFAIQEMMKKGMLIDVDHMSNESVNATLNLAERFNYPVNSGHNGVRSGPRATERSLSLAQFQRIAGLDGVVGMGTDGINASNFRAGYAEMQAAVSSKGVAIGTDVNGFAKLPIPPGRASITYSDRFPMCQTGNRRWDYNTEGVAHYGLMADFFKDVQREGGGDQTMEQLNRSAEFFALMWEKCERQKAAVR